MNAQSATGATVNVTTAGANVPLTAYQSLNGFAADGTNEEFTVPESGTYLLTYHVEADAATQLTTQLLQNGAVLQGSTIAAVAPLTNYDMTLLANLTANDTISLQLAGTTAVVNLNKADLTVIRLA